MYPESVPENYISILDDTNVKYAISPLHDRDINESTKEPKKPHWHCVLVFDSVKTFEQVKEITDKLNAPIPQKLNSLVGAVRYFTHKDNPEKAQYQESDIRAGNGFELSEVLAKTTTEKKAIVKEITQYIIDKDVIEFIDLVEYAMLNNDDWFELLQSGYTMFFTALIQSNRHSTQKQKERAKKQEEEEEKAFLSDVVIDKETGEIIE